MLKCRSGQKMDCENKGFLKMRNFYGKKKYRMKVQFLKKMMVFKFLNLIKRQKSYAMSNFTTPLGLSDRLSISLHIAYSSICKFYLSNKLEFLSRRNFSIDGYVNSGFISSSFALKCANLYNSKNITYQKKKPQLHWDTFRILSDA